MFSINPWSQIAEWNNFNWFLLLPLLLWHFIRKMTEVLFSGLIPTLMCDHRIPYFLFSIPSSFCDSDSWLVDIWAMSSPGQELAYSWVMLCLPGGQVETSAQCWHLCVCGNFHWLIAPASAHLSLPPSSPHLTSFSISGCPTWLFRVCLHWSQVTMKITRYICRHLLISIVSGCDDDDDSCLCLFFVVYFVFFSVCLTGW